MRLRELAESQGFLKVLTRLSVNAVSIDCERLNQYAILPIRGRFDVSDPCAVSIERPAICERIMETRIESRALGDVVVLAPEVFQDERGFFLEVFRADQFGNLGLPTAFVQENHSRSKRNVLRGLHFQWDPPMGKLMRVTCGTAYLVAVDIRKGSPTLGQWSGVGVSAQNKKQVWAPAGFARGFCALSDWVEVQYLCTAIYNSKGESGILWNDPALGIAWPVTNEEAVLSDKDRKARTLAQWLASSESDCFKYSAV